MARKTRVIDTKPLPPAAEQLRKKLVDRATERATAEVAKQVDKAVTKAFATTATKLEASGLLAESLEFWTRDAAATRKPRISRHDIAEVAIRIADAEGFDAVSMRRIASELDVGTMTLYHYLRTKDELLTLLVETVLGEVVLPPEQKMPKQWKAAITLIAGRSRDALRRHPWVLDISEYPRIGPNALLQFDQAWQALTSLTATVADKVDLLNAVDEFVFGFCLTERVSRKQEGEKALGAMADYIRGLLALGQYPALSSLTSEIGLPTLLRHVLKHSEPLDRFERNLGRLLIGFEATLTKA